jgi:SAM-dependent methyltransferase
LAHADIPRFEDITETTGIPLSPEAATMLYTRYHTAASLAGGKRVLELGCAAGQGLGMLSRVALQLVGGDYSPVLLEAAHKQFGARVPLVRLSADALPFRPSSFDLVLCFEASYYVRDMESAFDDIARVLAPGGGVLFVNANPERTDFIKSPHSIHYHSADEFRAALSRRGFRVDVRGAFAVQPESSGLAARVVGAALSIGRQILEGFGLVPVTLRGRARLKRLIYRKLVATPAELTSDFATAANLTPIESGSQTDYKVIYVRGMRVS